MTRVAQFPGSTFQEKTVDVHAVFRKGFYVFRPAELSDGGLDFHLGNLLWVKY